MIKYTYALGPDVWPRVINGVIILAIVTAVIVILGIVFTKIEFLKAGRDKDDSPACVDGAEPDSHDNN